MGVDEVLCEDELCKNNFGYLVLACILEHGLPHQRQQIALALLQDVKQRAMHRNASHVVEKALTHCSSDDQHALLKELCEPSTVVSLAQCQYGCFVLKSLISHPSVDSKS